MNQHDQVISPVKRPNRDDGSDSYAVAFTDYPAFDDGALGPAHREGRLPRHVGYNVLSDVNFHQKSHRLLA